MMNEGPTTFYVGCIGMGASGGKMALTNNTQTARSFEHHDSERRKGWGAQARKAHG
jgi:hypothetical protein